MSRDPHCLQALVLADALVVDAYRATKSFPAEERFGLQNQIRRGAVSISSKAVHGDHNAITSTSSASRSDLHPRFATCSAWQYASDPEVQPRASA